MMFFTLKMKIKKIIHTSTSEVYGTAKYIPIDETHPLQGQSPYAATKIGADQIALSFYRSFDLPIVILRPFNTFGPRQSLRAVIPTIINQALKGRDEIALGSTIPKRDFSYIDDTVDGFMCAIQSKNIKGEIINLGSGYQFSVLDTLKLISEIMGKKIKVKNKKNNPIKKPKFFGLKKFFIKKGAKLIAPYSD